MPACCAKRCERKMLPAPVSQRTVAEVPSKSPASCMFSLLQQRCGRRSVRSSVECHVNITIVHWQDQRRRQWGLGCQSSRVKATKGVCCLMHVQQRCWTNTSKHPGEPSFWALDALHAPVTGHGVDRARNCVLQFGTIPYVTKVKRAGLLQPSEVPALLAMGMDFMTTL